MDAEVMGGAAAMRERDPLHDRDREDAPHRVRAFGRVAVCLAPVFWAVARYLWEAPRAALWIGAVVLVWGLLSWLLPVPMGPVLRAWGALTRPLGLVVTSVLLALVYFLVLTPVSWVRRAVHRDPLGLRPRRGETSTYWRPKVLPPAPSPRWFRPF